MNDVLLPVDIRVGEYTCRPRYTYPIGSRLSSVVTSEGGAGDIQVFNRTSQEFISSRDGASTTYSIFP